MADKYEEVEARRLHLYQAGGAKQIEKQHQNGKLTARERVSLLLDEGTFQESDLWIKPIKTGFDVDDKEMPGDAIITGFGEIHGRPFYVFSGDLTVLGGTFGSGFHHKITRMMEMAVQSKVPIIQMIDSGGERIHDLFGRPSYRPVLGGKGAYAGESSMYYGPGKASGVIPQVTLMLGPSYAGSAYSPTMADFYIMRKGTSFMSVASPQLLKTVTSQDVTQDEIGGSVLHSTVSGIADFLLETDEKAIEMCRELVTYLPLNYEQKAPVVDLGDDPNRLNDDLLQIKPGEQPYDMHDVIRAIADRGRFLELQSLYAKSLIIGFARLNGQTVGIVANNPAESEGVLTLNTCDKQARFIRWCDAFNVPIVFLVDTPGFLPQYNDEQSREGMVRTVPKATFAICEATVPMISVAIGKNMGVSRLVMGTVRMGVDFIYSWPSSQVSRVNPQEAVDIIYKQEIDSAQEPSQMRQDKLEDLYKNYIRYPYHAAEQVMVNDIIRPQETRQILIRTLNALANKKPSPRPWRKHTLSPQ